MEKFNWYIGFLFRYLDIIFIYKIFYEVNYVI